MRGSEEFIRRPWSQRDLDRLASLYPGRPTVKVAKLLRRSVRSVYAVAAKLRLRKIEVFLASAESGRLKKGQSWPGMERTQFKKGHIPANKGLRRPGWAPGRMRETQFKKGERSGKAAENWKPIGTIRAASDGYLRIKVREAVHGKEPTGFGNVRAWPLYQRHIWEQHHGPIPPKHIVTFKDRNRSNCAIGNLELITMADNARRNAMWNRYPRELTLAIMANGALKRKIRRRNGKEQDQRPAGSPVYDDRAAQRSRQADGDRARQGRRHGRANDHQLGESGSRHG
jgi:hypothetical protein